MDLTGMSDAEITQLYENAQRELAGRQTRDAIVRDVTGCVDAVVAQNPVLMGEAWSQGRFEWDGECVRVTPAPLETAPDGLGGEAGAVARTTSASDPLDEVVPVVVPYEVGQTYQADTLVEWEGRTFRVLQGLLADEGWTPETVPTWFEEVGRA